MSGGAEAMLRMAAAARALAQLGARAAEEAAPKVEAVARASAAAGQAPDGAAWAPKKDGGRALANAPAAVTVRAVGDVLQVAVEGHHVFHQRGDGRLPERKIIPAPGDDIPEAWAAAIEGVAVSAFRKAVGT